MTKQEAELTETIGQVRAVRRFVGNLVKFGPETGVRGVNHLAAKRIEEGLISILRVAIDDLHDGSKADQFLFMQAEIATLETHQYLDEPIPLRPVRSMYEEFMEDGLEIR